MPQATELSQVGYTKWIMRGRLLLSIRQGLLLGLLGLLTTACTVDCEVSTYKLAECIAKDQAAQATRERHRIDCQTGELPVYYECWEQVDNSICDDAQRICAQYAGE